MPEYIITYKSHILHKYIDYILNGETMIALILAAGYGKRMQPLTDTTHKTMLKIGETEVIIRIIDGLRDNEIREIYIVTGYMHTQLTTFLTSKYSDINFHFIHNQDYRTTNNIFSLALAFEHMTINDDLMLIESDLIYESKVIQKIIDSPFSNVALIDKYRSGMDGTVVEVNDNIVTRIIPPHLQNEDFDFTDKYKTLNIYKFSQEFCNNEFKKLVIYYAQTFDNNCYYELILGILIYMQRDNIHAEILDREIWAEIDDPNDLKCAEFMFCPENRFDILQDSFGGYWNYDILDFCFIRNMYFPNPSIISDIRNNFPSLIHNYGSKQSILNEKLAYFLKCDKNNLQLLNGAAQIYPVLEEYFDGKQSLIPDPTFGEYQRIFVPPLTYSDTVGFNTDEIEEKTNSSDVIIIVNPNNPTGSIIPDLWLQQLIIKFPDKFFIIDESFIEFSTSESIMNHIDDNNLTNVLILKSLSKSLGIPGIRLGYAYTRNQEIMKFINHKIPIWNMNSVAEYFLEIILKHRDSLEESISKTRADRDKFFAELSQLPLIEKVYPSEANFILASININAEELCRKLLLEDSIYLKNISHKFHDNKQYLRIAVRSVTDNEKLIHTLQKISL